MKQLFKFETCKNNCLMLILREIISISLNKLLIYFILVTLRVFFPFVTMSSHKNVM